MGEKMTKTEEMLDGALQLIKEGEYERAAKLCDQIIENDGDSHRAYSMRSGCMFRLGRHSEAFRDVGKVMELDPQSPLSYFRRARWHLYFGKDEEAIKDLNFVIDSGEKYFLDNAHFLRALAYVNLGKKAEAVSDYLKVPEDFCEMLEKDRVPAKWISRDDLEKMIKG
jgi:tetratricopeptide (TPR) repeat protein